MKHFPSTGKSFLADGFTTAFSGARLRKLGIGGGPSSSKGNPEANLERIRRLRKVRACWHAQWAPLGYPNKRIWVKTSPTVKEVTIKRGRPAKHVSPSTPPGRRCFTNSPPSGTKTLLAPQVDTRAGVPVIDSVCAPSANAALVCVDEPKQEHSLAISRPSMCDAGTQTAEVTARTRRATHTRPFIYGWFVFRSTFVSVKCSMRRFKCIVCSLL